MRFELDEDQRDFAAALQSLLAGSDPVRAARAWAEGDHAPGLDLWKRLADLGVLSLQLGYNTGAAFSLGAGLPRGVIIVVTGLITAGVAVFAWRSAVSASAVVLAGLASVLGGAAANLADRARDGRVTDYLHTGWFPTFNLADVAICAGVTLWVLQSSRSSRAHEDANAASATEHPLIRVPDAHD